jgi:hypothetical protein
VQQHENQKAPCCHTQQLPAPEPECMEMEAESHATYTSPKVGLERKKWRPKTMATCLQLSKEGLNKICSSHIGFVECFQ